MFVAIVTAVLCCGVCPTLLAPSSCMPMLPLKFVLTVPCIVAVALDTVKNLTVVVVQSLTVCMPLKDILSVPATTMVSPTLKGATDCAANVIVHSTPSPTTEVVAKLMLRS